jgi:hypothetical protein
MGFNGKHRIGLTRMARSLLAGMAVPTAVLAAMMDVSKDETTGQYLIRDSGKPVLCYNYQTVGPGEVRAKVQGANLKYARPRSDYIHPLYGLNGEQLTLDWPVDHPHHRGIYWAWPEVDYRGERGDLHALQRVFARPTGLCTTQDGPDCARIEAENLWRWEDQEPIVRELAVIRAWRSTPTGRFIDLEFHFTAMEDEVAIARRDMNLYGGLNIRLAPVKEQEIRFHTDPLGATPRRAWAELSGIFSGTAVTGLAVFQMPSNPHYPGDWIQYPEINWLQPTFPAPGTRYTLKQGEPLTLKFRLWIHAGKASETELADIWTVYVNSSESAPFPTMNPISRVSP